MAKKNNAPAKPKLPPEAEMSVLDKIIYIADYIEPNRNKAPHLEKLRKLAFEDLDQALFKILSDTLNYLKRAPKNLDPLTIQAYEYYKELYSD